MYIKVNEISSLFHFFLVLKFIFCLNFKRKNKMFMPKFYWRKFSRQVWLETRPNHVQTKPRLFKLKLEYKNRSKPKSVKLNHLKLGPLLRCLILVHSPSSTLNHRFLLKPNWWPGLCRGRGEELFKFCFTFSF